MPTKLQVQVSHSPPNKPLVTNQNKMYLLSLIRIHFHITPPPRNIRQGKIRSPSELRLRYRQLTVDSKALYKANGFDSKSRAQLANLYFFTWQSSFNTKSNPSHRCENRCQLTSLSNFPISISVAIEALVKLCERTLGFFTKVGYRRASDSTDVK